MNYLSESELEVDRQSPYGTNFIDTKFLWLTSFSLPFSELSLVRLALDLVD